jgi:hypothetical protein
MEEKQEWIIDGYVSAAVATHNAERRGVDGLTGSGQECGPFCVDYFHGCRGYVYITWDKRWIVPCGEVTDETKIEVKW